MDKQTQQQQEAFRQEAYELLGELESALLELEETPDDTDLIGRVFRAMHTIKGSGAMFGFDTISEFTHEIETAYDLVREGRLSVTKELINLSLSARDLIIDMLEASIGGEEIDNAKAEEIVSEFRSLMPDPELSKDSGERAAELSTGPSVEPDMSGSDIPSMVTYRIRIRPSEDLFLYGTDPLILLDELRLLGECHIIAHTDGIPPLSDIGFDSCYVFWDVILTTDRGKNAIEDVFIFVADTCDLSIQIIDEEDEEGNQEYKKIGQILVERGDLLPDEIENILIGRKRIGELLTEARIVTPDSIESALIEQYHVRKIRQNRVETVNAASIRVDADKLDSLVDLVGELVTVQARLSQQAASAVNGEIQLIAEEVERLVSELRDNTMSIRMLPIGTTFSRFKRLVRDLSESLGKEIVLNTEGGDTELDKTVLEKLNDPLIHIIRNSIDHGVETPKERAASGKPENGTITLSAGHKGSNVVIRIKDDGAGMDAEAIRQTAISKGLMSPGEELPESDLFGMIFEPGFSTAKAVTDVSGRGVGMDVVKKGVEALRGSIGVSSKRGDGTTITLELPLTLAIIEGFMVMIGDEHFVFPLSVVEECVEIPGQEMADVRRRNMMNIRGEVVPYQDLREVFSIESTSSEKERIVVISSGDQRVGFGVDSVIGQHQTVIKNLGKMYRDIKGISGATILGDGSVALILDVAQLISGAEKQS